MRIMPCRAAALLAAATILTCLGPVPGRAGDAARDPHAHPNGPHQTLPPSPYATAAKPPPAAIVPAAPPPLPVLPPPLVVPTRPVEPPPPPTIAADATGGAQPLADGMRVTFGTGETAINPATDAALKDLAKSLPAGATVEVVAYAAGTPDDPSTARRESLSRALQVRSVLIGSGIASPRIYVRAMGASVPPPPGVTPDRVDVTVTAPAKQAAPAPTNTPATPTATTPTTTPGTSAPPQKAVP